MIVLQKEDFETKDAIKKNKTKKKKNNKNKEILSKIFREKKFWS